MTKVPSDSYWDENEMRWKQDYVDLPLVAIGMEYKRIVLVPKYIARYKLLLDGDEYYNHYILNFLQERYLRAGDSLCRTLKN